MTGLINFRDVGGLPVGEHGRTRFGVLLRSDCPSGATESDAAYLREVIGLRTVVDLREAEHAAAVGRGPLGDLDYIAMPVGDTDTITPETRSQYYANVIDVHGDALAELVRRLSRPGVAPALVHCRLGQDRTGSVIALLLRLAGVADADICAEYAFSGRANDAIRERARRHRAEQGLPPIHDGYFAAWDPTAAVMAAALRISDERWGGGWAGAHGLSDADLAAWRSVLVEPVV
jgi:protein-tyrosine phosphatase